MSKMRFLLLPKLASTTVFSISRNRNSTFSPSSNYMEVLTTTHHSVAKAWCKLPSLFLIITHISTLSPHFPCASQAICIQFSSVQSLSRVRLFVTPWISAHQASLSITNSWSLLKLMSIELVMPSSHLILCLCCPLLLLPPIPSSIRVFSNESTLHMRWPKY